MNIRFNALRLSASLALMGSMVAPAFADEWNKETKFEFSAPVEIPGRVLTAGKYVFRLADSDSDRNIVLIYSEDAGGAQKFVTTVTAVPAYVTDTPDKPKVEFEERSSGSPEAIHRWFYPGDNTGWEFVYPKAEPAAISSNTTPAPAPAPAATSAPAPDPAPAAALPAAPAPDPAPALAAAPEPAGAVTVREHDVVIIAQNDAQAAPETDSQSSAPRILPETAGYSALALLTGLAMLGGGVLIVFAVRCKSQA
jgi:hypothetical protein